MSVHMIAQQGQLVEEASGLFATNCVGIAGFTLLVWDHIVTFGDEIAVIWNSNTGRKRGIMFYTFVVLRYFTPLAYTIQLCSYFISPTIWTPRICSNYVVFEGSVVVACLGMVAIMMMIRVYALYSMSKSVLLLISALFVFQFCIQGWLLSRSHAVPRTSGLFRIAGCSMLFDESFGGWRTAVAWLPLIYDTVIFILTICKTAHVLRIRPGTCLRETGPWISRTLLRDGALYYVAIIASNVPLIVMISAAPDSIRNIAGQLQCFVTVTMMSRITLSLRREDSTWEVGSVISQVEPIELEETWGRRRRADADAESGTVPETEPVGTRA